MSGPGATAVWQDEVPADWSEKVLNETGGWKVVGEAETLRLELKGSCPYCSHANAIYRVIPAEFVRGLQEAATEAAEAAKDPKKPKRNPAKLKVETVFCECSYSKEHQPPGAEKGCGRRGEVEVRIVEK